MMNSWTHAPTTCSAVSRHNGAVLGIRSGRPLRASWGLAHGGVALAVETYLAVRRRQVRTGTHLLYVLPHLALADAECLADSDVRVSFLPQVADHLETLLTVELAAVHVERAGDLAMRSHVLRAKGVGGLSSPCRCVPTSPAPRGVQLPLLVNRGSRFDCVSRSRQGLYPGARCTLSEIMIPDPGAWRATHWRIWNPGNRPSGVRKRTGYAPSHGGFVARDLYIRANVARGSHQGTETMPARDARAPGGLTSPGRCRAVTCNESRNRDISPNTGISRLHHISGVPACAR